jgi:hypothetical protein
MERISCLSKIDCQGPVGIGLCDQNDPGSPIHCCFLLRLRRSLELADGGSLFLKHSDTLVVSTSPPRIALKKQPTELRRKTCYFSDRTEDGIWNAFLRAEAFNPLCPQGSTPCN